MKDIRERGVERKREREKKRKREKERIKGAMAVFMKRKRLIIFSYENTILVK
jgi:hypothetical protein